MPARFRAWLSSPDARYIALLCAIALCAVFVRLWSLPLMLTSDYVSYRDTAQYIAHAPDSALTDSVRSRMLKPLEPLLVAALAPFFGYVNATIVQAVAFYFALLLAMYLLAREFLESDRETAFIATLACVLSYPLLRYGIDVLTETGAIFFYVISLWLTLRFAKTPSLPLFLCNVLAITLGFLWKEYSIIAAIVFGLAILFHRSLVVRQRAAYVVWYAALFLAVHIPWQTFVDLTYHYSYISWYHQGGTPGFASEFTLKNIVKSTGALLGLFWLLVPLALWKWRSLSSAQLRFLLIAVPPPFIAYAWGFVSSRLLFVLAPPFILLAAFALRSLPRWGRFSIAALAIAANIAWLFLSYSVTL
jgi:hypothetical protein